MERRIGVDSGPFLRSPFLAIAVALSILASLAHAQDEFKAMKVRELKAFLEKRGADCLACSSKDDYIQRAIETKDWPEIEDINVEDLFKEPNPDDERMAKLRAELEKSGVDTSKLFNGKVFNAEELAKAFKQQDPQLKENGAKPKVDPNSAPDTEAATDVAGDPEPKTEL